LTARRQGDRPRPSWQTWVPLGLVVVSLLALAVLPDSVARRVARLQQEVAQRVTPVRNQLHTFGLAFAREVLAFRAWALTGDAAFADEYRRSAEDADRSLESATRSLSGTDLAPIAAELRSTLEGWRGTVRQMMESRTGRADPLADLSDQQRRATAVLELTSRLDRRLGGWEEATAQRMQLESRRQAYVSLFLATVALAATVAVAMLSVQARRQARQLRYRAQEERALRGVAETAVRTRDEVLAIVSHDLRNPLNTISLAVGALESTDMSPEEETRTIQVVRRAVDRMNRLIADLLDVARLEAGQKLTIQAEPVDIGAVVTETCDGQTAEAGRKLVHLEGQVEDGLPAVHGDKHRLIQVLANLVGNALKFTGEGGHVTVGARRDGAGQVVVSVTDSGAGIAPEHLAQVFNPYWQARQTARLGAGLGLAIAKGIVEAHGGRIWATSTPGRGSTFAFSLPPLTGKPEAAAASEDTASRDAVARS
jgi:signal transduction histidine kinase